MRRLTLIRFGILGWIFAVRMATASVEIKQITLPSAEGSVVASAFSPDSSRIAVLRKVGVPNAVAPQYAMQIVELASGQEVTHGEVLNGGTPRVGDECALRHVLGRWKVSFARDTRVGRVVDHRRTHASATATHRTGARASILQRCCERCKFLKGRFVWSAHA